MAKQNHSTDCRVQGFNTFHLVQRKSYDLYCSCVCCSSQHHSNAKTKLSNRAGLSFFYSLRITYSFRGCKQSNCAAVIVPMVFTQERSLSTRKSPSLCSLVLLYCCIDVRTENNTNECGKFNTQRTHSFIMLGILVLGQKPNQSSRPGNSNTDRSHHVVLQAFVYKTAKPREATNVLEYQNIISTQKWKSAASNQQRHMVHSGKPSTKSYGTQRQAINKVIWYAAARNQQSHLVRAWRCLLYTSPSPRDQA